MKVRLTFKHPDITDDALDTVRDNDDEYDKMERTFMKFLEYGELLTVEFDTDNRTAIVVPK